MRDSIGLRHLHLPSGVYRGSALLALCSSPRGFLAIMRCAQALAACDRKSFILPDHVKAVLAPALGHRIILTPEARLAGRRPETLLTQIAASVEPPVGEAHAK